ncbi:venom factor-like, partial [Eucyclogobius newberryi]|uniref:venom factor-like n=1 Tax=Eucyclogobius newberryi TaxID=166745 RepID=UPI003B5AEBBC
VTVGREGHPSDLMPGKTLRLRVQAEPGSTVSLVAVDNSVYLLRRDRLTQSKIWGAVQKEDLGCSRGGGASAKGVFSDAGLLFFSDSNFMTDFRQSLQCPRSSRRRRSVDRFEHKAKLERVFKDELLRRCCVDGLRDVPMRYSCTRRSLYITESFECIRAFRHCCGKYRHEPIDPSMPTAMPSFITTAPVTTTAVPTFPHREFILEGIMAYGRFPLEREGFILVGAAGGAGRGTVMRVLPSMPAEGVSPLEDQAQWNEDQWDEEEWDEDEVTARSMFQESWLWEDVTLSSEVDLTTRLSSVTLERPLPDSITEWGIMAISASTRSGFCVAEPYNVRAWKPLFVDLKLPYSVARNEQVQIRAVVYNHFPDNKEVLVTLMKTDRMCSVAFRDRHVQEVAVAAGSSVVLSFTVVPLFVDNLPIEVMVVSKDKMASDRVQKNLRVVREGVQKTRVWSVVLNPAASGGSQTLRMGTIHLDSVVPNSVPETFISVRGNVLADSLENSLKQDSLAALIRMPGGCVEQNLASMSLPTIAFRYLDSTDDWGKVGAHLKDQALGFIRKGYTNQLAYRKSEGSYPPYRNQGASTWITAFVVKVFSMAHSIIGVDEQQVCEPLLFLLKHRYKSEQGIFREETPVYSTTMTGGLRGDDPQVTLTAFVLIALAEAKQASILCSQNEVNAEEVIRNTAAYLKRELQIPGRRPYTVAIASYALALLKDHLDLRPEDLKRQLLAASSAGSGQWLDNENRLFTLEATGYALLALLKMDATAEAAPAYEWLNSQRRQGGGYGSTQPTVVVLQALSEYLLKRPPPPNLQLKVDVQMGARSIPYGFDPDTSYAARTARLPDNVDLVVSAEGTGQGVLEVVTYYNQLHEAVEKTPCDHFELHVAIEESAEKSPPDVEKFYLMTIKVRALGPRDVLMVVLDVSLPTGFTPENSDLDQLSNSVDKYIANFKIVDNLSDRGSLILHLFKVSHKEQEILIFKLRQNFKVGHLQPSSVTVYEYYNPDHRCSRSFTPRESTEEELSQICSDHVCRCTQGDCCVPKKDSDNIPDHARETFACTSLHHVFKVKVLSVTRSYYDKYELQITQLIKLGAESGLLAGQIRTFMSHGSCRDELQLIPDQEYLIIGSRHDLWNTDSATNR